MVGLLCILCALLLSRQVSPRPTMAANFVLGWAAELGAGVLVMEALVPTELCALRGSLADSICIRRPPRRSAAPPSRCAERTAGTPFPQLDPQTPAWE